MTSAGIDYAQACDLPWTTARVMRQAALRSRTERLIANATAARAALLQPDAWRKWLAQLGNHHA
ncbi:MAG: hypothetical protein ACP5GC_07935 [Thiomonas sp.]